MADKKYMTIKEFRELGYVQELNRQFLHPLGLAIEVNLHDDGTESLGRVWDCRDDPEGIVFGENTIELAKAERVLAEQAERSALRFNRLGFSVQPFLRWVSAGPKRTPRDG